MLDDDVACVRPCYFRIQLSFETAANDYIWLNKILAIGSVIRLPQAVVYDAYAIR